MKILKPTRQFVDQNLIVDSWESIEKYFTDLINREIDTIEDFLTWLKDQSELEAILEEDAAWRYIKMTIDTKNEALSNSYTFFVTQIQPQIAPLDDQINRKLDAMGYTEELISDPAFEILFRRIKKSLELYREENIEIQSKLAEESQKFGSLSAAQSIEHNGEKLTMQQASLLLKETDESLRKEVFEKIANRRKEDVDAFDALFDSLLAKRHQIATNAGFENFRDYKMQAMGRFDYIAKRSV